MADITAIILTKNEEENLPECILSIQDWVKRIVVVDSFSTDETVEIAKGMGAEVIQHEFIHQAQQVIWAVNQLKITTTWIFRIDADERISKEASEEIIQICEKNDKTVNGIIVRFAVEFMGKKLYHGGIYPFKKLLIYRNGYGTMENRAMDEHITVQEGQVVELKHDSFHHDYKGLDLWIDKHNKYSTREVEDYLKNLNGKRETGKELSGKARFKRWFKFNVYYKMPVGTRSHLYFWYRYYIKGGFRDGKEGKIFCFLQAYWYRFLVDAKIYEQEIRIREKGNEENSDFNGTLSSRT